MCRRLDLPVKLAGMSIEPITTSPISRGDGHIESDGLESDGGRGVNVTPVVQTTRTDTAGAYTFPFSKSGKLYDNGATLRIH